MYRIGVDLGGTNIAVGIGSPGICDGAAGTVRNAHNLRWYGVPIVEMPRERVGLPARLSNDANCAALGNDAGIIGAAALA